MTGTLRPPEGGMPPPEVASLPDGSNIELKPLAEEICRRYRLEFADEADRYGGAGIEWCVHDNQHILSWAALSATFDPGILTKQVAWLASVLAARSFPLDRLNRDLEIAAEVLLERGDGAAGLAAALQSSRVDIP